ncbi:transcriptional regulator, GntR family [Gemmobacter aquatilis]|uniref:Transcriptional regulator, GntR family n=1 Tax=Gemmobacter aquatilis TaxID=933059 RepID=A0A1H8H5B6_9RHOB|nr:GntR family transcriptional regulator [Gemmobacter aquatilis]SEN51542.1 transcriptional regulator, GntR family [Gemmobacter aquatilis]
MDDAMQGQGETARKVPTHELTYARLRDMVMFGVLAPGQPVTIQGLIRDLDAGMTPVREAIRRLTAEGALSLQDNRRVTVPRMTKELFEQLVHARLAIEPKLAELAAPKVTPALIARLTEIDAGIEPAIRAGDVQAYLRQNHAFHFALYEVAGATVLEDITRSLWLRFGPSLRAVLGRYIDSGLPDRHAEALAAMRAGDAAALAQAIRDDILQGVEQVQEALAAGEA